MKEKILSSLLAVLACSTMQAQTVVVSSMPRLVVGITVDQLRSDYLEAFAALYNDKGFKRMWKEGRVYSNASYDFNDVDASSALASIYTGTTPSRNGIVASQWLDRSILRNVTCVDDRNFIGYYTDENSSPKNLLVSTITDQLKVATQGQAIVYAIAPDREEAILSAGHAADGAFWLNNETGKWCGTTYYGKFPRWMTVYNDNNSTDTRISEMKWEPYFHEQIYTNPSNESFFHYNFTDARKYRRLKQTPCINSEVNRTVRACLYGTSLGSDQVTDFLSVTYYAGSYQGESGKRSFLELQDSYARLDSDIGSLLDMIDKRVGLENTLIFLTSTGYAEEHCVDDSEYRIPTGDFYMHRATALLNMYLMALYGEGQYIEATDGLHIYFDRKLLETKHLRVKDILDRSAEFLAELSGVQNVYTSYDLLRGGWHPELSRTCNSFHPHRSGDIIIEVNAGWKLLDASDRRLNMVHHADINFPLIFFGAGIEPKLINTPVSTNCISPTLALLMRIRAPNACTEAPLTDLYKTW